MIQVTAVQGEVRVFGGKFSELGDEEFAECGAVSPLGPGGEADEDGEEVVVGVGFPFAKEVEEVILEEGGFPRARVAKDDEVRVLGDDFKGGFADGLRGFAVAAEFFGGFGGGCFGFLLPGGPFCQCV